MEVNFVGGRDTVIATITIELSWTKILLITIIMGIRTNCDFVINWFRILAMPFAHAEGPDTFVGFCK